MTWMPVNVHKTLETIIIQEFLKVENHNDLRFAQKLTSSKFLHKNERIKSKPMENDLKQHEKI